MNITHILPVLYLGHVSKKMEFFVTRRQFISNAAENQGTGLA